MTVKLCIQACAAAILSWKAIVWLTVSLQTNQSASKRVHAWHSGVWKLKNDCKLARVSQKGFFSKSYFSSTSDHNQRIFIMSNEEQQIAPEVQEKLDLIQRNLQVITIVNGSA